MQPVSDPLEEVRGEVEARLRDLQTCLVAHGFTAEIEYKFWALTVVHAADTAGVARSARVQLATDQIGRLWWYWSTGRIEDVEELTPAAAIAEATDAIARRLHEAGRS